MNGFEIKSSIPKSQFLEFSYENFTENPLSFLESAYQTLNLGDFNKIKSTLQSELKGYSNYRTNQYGLNPDLEVEIFNRWRFVFEAYGYPSTLSSK